MAKNTNHSSVIGTDGPGQRSRHKQDLRDLTENYRLVTRMILLVDTFRASPRTSTSHSCMGLKIYSQSVTCWFLMVDNAD